MGQMVARALWYTAPGKAELREERFLPPRRGEVLVRTLYSGVSRGTERLISSGLTGESELQRMRCPLQSGAFPFPVKYGYCAVGRVEEGPAELRDKTVFVLHPHQDLFKAPAEMAHVVPEGVPPRRAALTANMETALNALWDSGAGPSWRIAIVGGGILGLLAGHIAARLSGAEVTIVDIVPERREIAAAMGCNFAPPDAAPDNCDTVFHTSATAAGLATAIGCAGYEAAIVELSWYGGESAVPAPLGGAFHSKRLKLISSQAGQVAPHLRPRWSRTRRMNAALNLLGDSGLDVLTDSEIAFEDTPHLLPMLLKRDAAGLPPVIHYSALA
jgi:NADPH:quinone reductase-like Zn-dependent oxidoreductase